MDQELLREQCEAFVMGGLDDEERARIQLLIDQEDLDCLEAIREAGELVAQLGFLAPTAAPPALLRGRVLSQLRPAQTRRKQSWVWPLGWAVAAGLSLFAFLQWQERDLTRQQLLTARGQIQSLSEEAQRNRQVLAILMARDSRSIRLVTSAPEAPVLRAHWSRTGGMVLVGSNIPRPAAGRALQLWVVPKNGNPISAGVFQPDPNGQVMMIASSVASPDQAAALAISDEPVGGSPQPTTKPNWVGALSE